MTVRRIALPALVAAVAMLCLSAATGCRTTGPCGLIMIGSPWWSVSIGPPLLLFSTAIVAWTVRLAMTTSRLSFEVARLQLLPVPVKLARSSAAAHLDRVACVATSIPVAFCAGLLRPTVFVSQGAVTLLSERELLAVVHHEADHARRREPVRRAACTAAADVMAFLPIVRWWSERRLGRSELAADMAAERSAGAAAVAGALLLMTAPSGAMAAFGGHDEMRARRVPGLRVEEARPSRAMWASTLVYAGLALSLAGCLFEVVAAPTSW